MCLSRVEILSLFLWVFYWIWNCSESVTFLFCFSLCHKACMSSSLFIKWWLMPVYVLSCTKCNFLCITNMWISFFLSLQFKYVIESYADINFHAHSYRGCTSGTAHVSASCGFWFSIWFCVNWQFMVKTPHYESNIRRLTKGYWYYFKH